MDKRNVVLISIGNELLSGKTLNTNLKFLSEFFTKNNYKVKIHLTLLDNKNDIIRNVKKYIKPNNTIVITGGLGPTNDDITLEAIAELLNRRLIINNELMKKLKKFFKNDIELLKKQCTIIEDSKILKNKAGIAPGYFIEYKKTDIFLLPGVPHEVEYIITNEVKKCIKIDRKENTVFTLAGITENEVYALLKSNIDKVLLKHIMFFPSYSGVEILLNNEDFNNNELKLLKKKIKTLLNYNIISNRSVFLPEIIKKKFINKKLTLSIAESCTGGLVSKLLTDYSGSSKYFKGSVIAYSNEIKKSILNIDNKTLKKGAVSKETAKIMAENIRKIFKTDYGISITGIAGPTGGTKQKPVGLVWFAISNKKQTKAMKRIFLCDRECVRKMSAQYALFYLYKGVRNE